MSTNSGDGLSVDESSRPKASGSEVVTGRVRWYVLVSLILLTTTLAEFLTGSTPLLGPINQPLGFALNLGLYGGGAVLIKEATIRWRKRWGGVLLLGGAYAVGEEGFAAKTMINPASPIIGNQSYTHSRHRKRTSSRFRISELPSKSPRVGSPERFYEKHIVLHQAEKSLLET